MSAFTTEASVPCEMVAGETNPWTETLADYADPDYTVAYHFAGATPVDGFQKFTVDGTGSGTSWSFAFATTVKPGRYAWQKAVTRVSPSRVEIIDSGHLTVKPNLSVTPTTTTAQTLLAALETAITSLASTTNQSVSFNGQSFTKKDMRQLLDERTRLQAEVLREQDKLAALTGNNRDMNIGIRFQ